MIILTQALSGDKFNPINIVGFLLHSTENRNFEVRKEIIVTSISAKSNETNRFSDRSKRISIIECMPHRKSNVTLLSFGLANEPLHKLIKKLH